MLEQLLEILKEIEQNDELFETQARIMRKMFDNLMRAGFTEEQATTIVAAQGIGVKAS